MKYRRAGKVPQEKRRENTGGIDGAPLKARFLRPFEARCKARCRRQHVRATTENRTETDSHDRRQKLISGPPNSDGRRGPNAVAPTARTRTNRPDGK